MSHRIDILKDHQEPAAAKFICNQLEYFMVTEKVSQEDKDTVSELLGTSDFDYTLFYNQQILEILKSQILPILKKNENICHMYSS